MITSLRTIGHFFLGVNYGDLARSTIDVLIVAYFVYQLMMLAKPTRAWQIIIGLFIMVAVFTASKYYQLETLNWLLSQLFPFGPVALVILFYPEARHALEELGRIGIWSNGFVGLTTKDISNLVSEIVRAAMVLSGRKTGALIVIEREIGLADIIDTGTPLNAEVTAELLGTIFHPGSPLHDGAVIIRRGRIAAAGCTLPLTDSPNIGTSVHTRHKAAIGITEQSDAVVVVVSEETGIISVAMQGNLTRHLRDAALETKLAQVLEGKDRQTLRKRLTVPRKFTLPMGVKGFNSNPGKTTPDASSKVAAKTGKADS
jgi:diadenylate cyclase